MILYEENNIKVMARDFIETNRELVWSLTVIYDDKEEIEVGFITIVPGYGSSITEGCAVDGNYIYIYYENGYMADDVVRIFDLKAKREISNQDERDMIYREFLEMRNLNLTNIRERNKRLEQEERIKTQEQLKKAEAEFQRLMSL